MYYRISGAPFTVRNAEEKKEFIDAINADSNFSRHLVCRGVDAEQFTGKVNGVVVCEKNNPNKVYVFKCDGNFPTLKLYQRTSSVIHVVEFPTNKTIREETVPEKAEEKKVKEVQEVESVAVEKIEEPELPKVEEIVEKTPDSEPVVEYRQPEGQFLPDEIVVPDVVEEQEEESQEPEIPMEEESQPKHRKRSRKKKS